MLSKRRSCGALAATLVALVACSGACSTGRSSAPDATSSEIINGTLDTKHQAVVAVIAKSETEQEICSGTIVKVDLVKRLGWVVTAAHCVETLAPEKVVLGNDINRPAVEYKVIDFAAEPRYGHVAGSPFDFAVLQITNVTEATPFIPLASADDEARLGVGTKVTSVGFGRTTLEADAASQDTRRWMVDKELAELTPEFAIYEMATSGFCTGDSGGPLLAGEGETERVVGIHSHIKVACNGRGVSGRPSAATDFFAAELARGRATDSCPTCVPIETKGIDCMLARRDCLKDGACEPIYGCVAAGRDRAECLVGHETGAELYRAAERCSCEGLCRSACVDATTCAPTPACGYAKLAAPPDCGSCIEGACCAESIALLKSDSADCVTLLGPNVVLPGVFDTERPPAKCPTSEATANLKRCAAAHCSTQCLSPANGDAGAPPDPQPSTRFLPPPDTAPSTERESTTPPPDPTPVVPPQGPGRKASGCAAAARAPSRSDRPIGLLLAIALSGAIFRRRRR